MRVLVPMRMNSPAAGMRSRAPGGPVGELDPLEVGVAAAVDDVDVGADGDRGFASISLTR